MSADVRLRVAECFAGNKRYDFIWERLDDEYGDSARSSEESFNEILDLLTVKANDSKALRDFIVKLHATVVALNHEGLRSELTSPVNRARLERKPPPKILKDWVRYVSNQRENQTIDDLSKWLDIE